jgi:hypothetical protein
VATREENDIRRYAVTGAEHRLLEIAEEAAEIFRVFPELRERGRGFDAIGARAAENTGATQEPQKRRRRRSKMSADARRRISEAQKARWATRKAQAGAEAAPGRKKK